MGDQSRILYVAMILGALLSCVAAWIIAWRYGKRMKYLMQVAQVSQAVPAGGAPGTADTLPDPPVAAPVTLAENRAAGIRLTFLLIGTSVLIALTSAWIWWTLTFPGEPFRPKRMAVIWLLHLWPVIPALALMWRWSRKRLFGALLLWCVVCYFIFIWRQVEYRPVEALTAIVIEVGLGLVLVSLVFLGNAARAIAPWLLVPLAVLIWAALTGLQFMVYTGENNLPLLSGVAGILDPVFGDFAVAALIALCVLVPLIVLWWPARMIGRAFGRAYSRKWLTDLLVIFTAVWAISLTDRALTTASQAGVAAFALLIPLLWIPALMWLARFWNRRRGRPPTLLVLRVFQQDKQTQRLFDQVVERWRLSGNTLTIAGTDLKDRTLDAGDIFEFLDHRLRERFVTSPADVPRRIAGFDMAADYDGRYRVNECYCHDSTWKVALQTLVRHSDVVLMDLRGFQEKNAGSHFELVTLAQVPRELRVVLLTDANTNRKVAQEAVAGGRQERFKWIEASKLDSRKRREVLASLFA